MPDPYDLTIARDIRENMKNVTDAEEAFAKVLDEAYITLLRAYLVKKIPNPYHLAGERIRAAVKPYLEAAT